MRISTPPPKKIKENKGKDTEGNIWSNILLIQCAVLFIIHLMVTTGFVSCSELLYHVAVCY